MKTKFNFAIASQTIAIGAETVTTPNINIETEVDASILELKGLYDLQKTAMKEAPALVEEFMKGLYEVYQTCMTLSDKMEKPEPEQKTATQEEEDKWI